MYECPNCQAPLRVLRSGTEIDGYKCPACGEMFTDLEPEAEDTQLTNVNVIAELGCIQQQIEALNSRITLLRETGYGVSVHLSMASEQIAKAAALVDDPTQPKQEAQ